MSVGGGADLGHQLRQGLGLLLDWVERLAFQRFANLTNECLGLRLLLRIHLVAKVDERLLRLEGECLRLISEVHRFAAGLVLRLVLLRLADHAVHIILPEHRAAGDAHLLLFPGGAILRLHIEDAVRINVERHLDLRHAPWRGRDPVKDELPERLVVRCELALALQHVDLHLRLVV